MYIHDNNYSSSETCLQRIMVAAFIVRLNQNSNLAARLEGTKKGIGYLSLVLDVTSFV